jgi:hypothetical protein
VHANEFSRKIIGPLVGLFQPLPFLEPLNSINGIFLTIYGIFYLYIFTYVVAYIFFIRKNNVYISISIIALILISYYVVGSSSPRARYFSPFFPIMILGFIQVKSRVKIRLNRYFIRI